MDTGELQYKANEAALAFKCQGRLRCSAAPEMPSLHSLPKPHNLPYSYTLLCYDENGSEREITFGISRELRDGAFIRLTVMPVRGVLDWSELQYDELPAMVQNHYAVPLDD